MPCRTPDLYSTGRTASPSISTTSARPDSPSDLRPERNAAQDSTASFRAVLSTIHAPVRPRASDGVRVVGPDAVAVNQRTLTRAVGEVFNRGDRNYGLKCHRPLRSDGSGVVRRSPALIPHALPPGMDPEGRPSARTPRVPDIKQRVNASSVQRLLPCWPDELSLFVAPRNFLPRSFPPSALAARPDRRGD